jgi:hypothetical protein
LPAHLGEILALVEQFVALGEFSDHLFGGVVPLLHDVLLAPFWSIRTLVRGLIYMSHPSGKMKS